MNGIFFDLQTVRARDLGAAFGGILSDGKLSGCALSYSGVNLTIAHGYYIAKGRLIEIDSAETLETATTAANGYGRLRLVIDLSIAASESSFTQGKFEWDYASTNSFSDTTQNDINDGTNTSYQVEICRVSFANSQITGIVSQIGNAVPSYIPDPSDIGAQERFLCGRNQTIATSAWASDTTYTEYPYRASVTLPIITAVSFVEIVFSPADATSGNFAPVCDTYAGGVYLYAKAVPDAAITIPTIIVWR
ncbi:MAG: hypothetical protein ACI4NU_09860 [Christensenellales bacterium]